jgi:hypothetical protein
MSASNSRHAEVLDPCSTRGAIRRSFIALALLSIGALACSSPQPGPQVTRAGLPLLNSAQSFAVLSGQTVTNTGPTTISGDLGLSPGTAVTGFPPGLISGGTIHAADAVALQAQSDLTVAYVDLAARPCNTDLTGVDLAGQTLVAGVYCFTSSAQLSGALALDAQGNPDALFVFRIGSTLTTASGASVRVINGGQDCNVFWQVGSSATLGTTTAFVGSILALTSIDLATGASVSGRVLARNGSVTMDSNRVTVGICATCALTTCGTACVDTGTDQANCGTCGNACAAGATCTAGVCITPCAQTRCGAACVDTGVDAANCGACGHACAAGSSCAAGTCVAGCTGTMCGQACVDTHTNTANCGACGNACASGETCAAGVCVALCTGTACGQACVDTRTDAANCGACANACAPGELCGAGVCRPPICPGTLCCGQCVDTNTDANHCGACGAACEAGSSCVSGVCRAPCPGMVCGGACVDTSTDVNNCGACGVACMAGSPCNAGVCATCCAGTTCGGMCVDTNTDVNNCGACGVTCMAGSSCHAGVCGACTCDAGVCP